MCSVAGSKGSENVKMKRLIKAVGVSDAGEKGLPAYESIFAVGYGDMDKHKVQREMATCTSSSSPKRLLQLLMMSSRKLMKIGPANQQQNRFPNRSSMHSKRTDSTLLPSSITSFVTFLADPAILVRPALPTSIHHNLTSNIMQSTQPVASSSSSAPVGPNADRLYVGNLSPTVDEFTLIQIFSKYGKITKLDFMFHKTGVLKGKPRGFAFIQFLNKAVSGVHMCAERCREAHT